MNEEYNSVYDVDLAILDAVRQGGGGGGTGVSSGQVQTMIDSALTPYSTTSQVEDMISASAGTGGDYVTVASLTAITSPTAGMVANVYDPASSANTTGEWWYDGTAWRPKKVWIERLSAAERVDIYNWIWQRNQGEEPEFNYERQCQVMWQAAASYPMILTSTNNVTWEGYYVTWGSVASANDADVDRVHYIRIDNNGDIDKGYRKIAKQKESIWEDLEISADGTVTDGNGWQLMQPLEFDPNGYQFANEYKVIKCEASGQTFYGRIVSFVRLENETDNGEITGIITIGSIPYIGVWGVNDQWGMYKKSFTQIA